MRGALVILTLLTAATAIAQTMSPDLTQKQLAMFAAEAQFYSTLAKEQHDELDKLKANNPCGEPK
jgi:hypothetical protein